MSVKLILTSHARPAVRSVVACLLLAVAASSAAGQLPAQTVASTTSVLLEDIGGPVAPGSVRNLSVTVTYNPGLGAVPVGPTRVTVEAVEVPSWATFVIDPDSFDLSYDPTSADPTTGTAPPEQRAVAVGVLSVSAGAPAFLRGNLTLIAEAQPNGNIRGSQGTTQVFVIPGFNGTLRIDAPDEVTIRGGIGEGVEFSLTNLGNSEALITFALPSKPELALTTLPEPVTVAPNETIMRTIGLRASWVEGGSGLLTIQATPSLDGRRDVEVEPTTHDVLVTSVAAIPAAPTAGLLAVLLGLALVRRRP